MIGKVTLKNADPLHNVKDTFMLGPTATFAWRRCNWTRVTSTGYPVFGILVIEEARREGLKVTTSRYAVSELKPDMGRRFQLSKPMQVGGEKTFVLLGPGYDECTCTGYAKHGKCKHAQALREVWKNGGLPRVTKSETPLPGETDRHKTQPVRLPKSKKNSRRGR
jgi:hypothetical protein